MEESQGEMVVGKETSTVCDWCEISMLLFIFMSDQMFMCTTHCPAFTYNISRENEEILCIFRLLDL